MTSYVEINLHVYDQGEFTTGVGPFRSHAKAEEVAARLYTRLTRGQAKAALDEIHGGGGEYNVTVSALRLRSPSQAYKELVEGGS